MYSPTHDLTLHENSPESFNNFDLYRVFFAFQFAGGGGGGGGGGDASAANQNIQINLSTDANNILQDSQGVLEACYGVLQNINVKDFATETTLQSIDAKLDDLDTGYAVSTYDSVFKTRLRDMLGENKSVFKDSNNDSVFLSTYDQNSSVFKVKSQISIIGDFVTCTTAIDGAILAGNVINVQLTPLPDFSSGQKYVALILRCI